MNTAPEDVQRNGTDSSVSRRTIVRGAAWSVPVIAAAAAVPLSAASTTDPQVNLWSTARLPNSQRDGVYLGNNYYQGPRSLSFTYTFGNLGPDELPSGGRLSFGLPFAAIWVTNSFVITSSDGYPLTPAGTRTETIAEEPVLAVRQLWDYVLLAPLPAGATFTVNFTVQMNGTSNTATDHWQVRPTSDFQPGDGITDTDPGNNRDYSDNYAYFNHSKASA